MVSAFCKMRENKRGAFGRRRKPKPAKTENRFCSEFSLKTHGKPGPQIFADTPKEKLWYNRIIWKKLSCFMGLEIRRN